MDILAILDKALEYMQYVVENWTLISQRLLAILGAASIVARITPSTWDDNFIAKTINIIGLTKAPKDNS